MSKVRRMQELVDTLDVIKGFEAEHPSIAMLQEQILNKDAAEAEVLYHQLLARILNQASPFLHPQLRALPIEALNAAMHFLHVKHGDSIRQKTIRELGENDACVLFTRYSSGTGMIPSELEELFEEIQLLAKHYPDTHVDIGTTWNHTHDVWGSLYVYRENEFPCLRIRSLSHAERDEYVKEVIRVCEKQEESVLVSIFGPKAPNIEEFYFR